MQNYQDLIRVLFVGILLYLFYTVINPFLGLLIITIVFTILFYPLYGFLLKNRKINENIASLITVLASLLFVVLPLFGLLTLLVNEAVVFVRGFDSAALINQLSNLNNYTLFGYTIDFKIIKNLFLSSLNSFAVTIAQSGGAILTKIFNSFGYFVVFITLFFYLLRDGKDLASQLSEFLPYSKSERKVLLNSFQDTTKTVVLGNLSLALASGLIAFIGFYLFGFGTPLIWAVVAIVFSFIPTLGPIILYLLGTVALFFSSPIIDPVLFILYFIFLEIIIKDNFIKPKVLDSKIKSHPVLVLLSIFGGVSAFGSIGLLYGPLILTILFSVITFKTSPKNK
jgi:predicted PurR-regulated permease PerM